MPGLRLRTADRGLTDNRLERTMNNEEFREVLAWRMCSDPFPESVNAQVVEDWLDRESRERGYPDWIVAYHET